MAAGYDAGVRLGEVIEKDMIAVPLTGQQRERVVASPSIWRLTAYLSTPRADGSPVYRLAPSRTCPYRWEFEEAGVPFDVAIEPQITTNDLRLMLSGTGRRRHNLSHGGYIHSVY